MLIRLSKGYHLEHHKRMGEDGIDTDLPTRLELLFLNNVLGKVFFWCAIQLNYTWMYAMTLNSFQHVSNSILCASSWICTIAEANNVALPQHLRPACVQLRRLFVFRPKAPHIPYSFKLFCWELASFSWTFHCRALFMGRIRTRNVFLLRHPEHPGIQCDISR